MITYFCSVAAAAATASAFVAAVVGIFLFGRGDFQRDKIYINSLNVCDSDYFLDSILFSTLKSVIIWSNDHYIYFNKGKQSTRTNLKKKTQNFQNTNKIEGI